MPVVRVSLLKGKSPEYLRALSDSVQRAMVETFNVPPRDRFMIVHQHEPNELIFDRTYLAGPRSDDFVLIAISIGKPRSPEMRQAFFKRLVDLLGQAPGLRPEDIMVFITASTPDDWSFGNGVAQMTHPGWEALAWGDAA